MTHSSKDSPPLVFLIGYRGSGKTTVGHHLAAMAGGVCIDSDDRIETDAGCTIAEIFADEGESGFRKRETEAIAAVMASATDRSLTSGSGTLAVISLGGGAPMFPASRELIGGRGKCVWLRGKPATLYQRISGDDTSEERRPDLTDTGGMVEVEHMLALRESTYDECADLIVDVDDATPEEVAANIFRWLSK